MTPYSLEFRIEGLPKTTNAKRGFGHWAQYYRESVKWKKEIIPYLVSKKPPSPLQKARLTLTRWSSVRPDHDGLVSSFKHVIDGLVDAGVLVNDKFENIGQPDYRWEKAPQGKGFITVVVQQVNSTQEGE
jgi:hypothetical protein